MIVSNLPGVLVAGTVEQLDLKRIHL